MDAMMIMHPDDAKAIEVLRSIKGFDKVARVVMDFGYERLYRGETLGEMVKVNSDNFPQVYFPFLEVVKTVGIDEPELFIYNDPIMNAFTYGDNSPFIAISSSMVEKIVTRDEMKCVIAHECGHILCHHTLYLTMLAILENLGFALQIVSEALLLPLLAGLFSLEGGEVGGDAVDVQVDEGLLALRTQKEVAVSVVVHEEGFGEDDGATVLELALCLGRRTHNRLRAHRRRSRYQYTFLMLHPTYTRRYKASSGRGDPFQSHHGVFRLTPPRNNHSDSHRETRHQGLYAFSVD